LEGGLRRRCPGGGAFIHRDELSNIGRGNIGPDFEKTTWVRNKRGNRVGYTEVVKK